MKSPVFGNARGVAAKSRLRMALLGSVALAIVAGAPAVQAAQPDTGTTTTTDQSVSIAAFAFAPTEVAIPVGATLTWTNAQDGVPHTTTSADGVWDSGALSTNDTFGFTFALAGDFAYLCTIHPTMRGIVHVVADANDQSVAESVAAATAQPTATPRPAAPAAPAAPQPTATPVPYYHY
jgi:plastocyanin